MAMKTEQSPGSSSDSESIPNVQEFLEEKCVLVVGATGFLGKVLVEKLLRSCPRIKTIFVLICSTRKQTTSEIFSDFIRSNVFSRVLIDQPDALMKIVSSTACTTCHEFNIQEAIYKRIIKNVSIVFHCESVFELDADPEIAMEEYLLGVKNVLKVCRSCERLEAFVHVFPPFSFCNCAVISEEMHPELPDSDILLLRWTHLKNSRPNCKTFLQSRQFVCHLSNALEETLIVESRSSVPTVVVRPSILTASISEPFPGWTDNLSATSLLLAELGKCTVRTLLVKDNVNAHFVPVDIVANTLIVAAHYKAVKSVSEGPPLRNSTTFEVPIINCTCPENNLITWRRVIEICLPLLEQYPSMQVYGKPGCTVTDNLFWYNLCRLMSHYVPAVLIDVARCLALKKPQMISHYKSIHGAMDHFEFYTTTPLFYNSPNMRLLEQQISPEDAELFPIDSSTLDWTVYMKNYVLGVRRFLLKESEESLPAARTKMIRMHYFWLALKLSSIFGMFLLLCALKKRNYIHFLKSLLPSFSCITSVTTFVQRKLVLPLSKKTNIQF